MFKYLIKLRKKLGNFVVKNFHRNYFSLLKIIYKIQGQPFIISHFANIRNFGDNFNFDLLEHYGYRLIWTEDYKKSQVALTGSILGSYLRDFNGIVLGSGFIRERYNRVPNNWNVKLIRGPLSAKQCGVKNIPYGDPGLLASDVYSKYKKFNEYKLGILPHSKDYDALKNKKFENVLIINPRLKSRQVASQISKCDKIVSSSLHGLIFADSFQIPNLHIILSNKTTGKHHKFNDYYKGCQKKHNYIDFTKKEIVEKDINYLMDHCKQTFNAEELKELKTKLNKIFKTWL